MGKDGPIVQKLQNFLGDFYCSISGELMIDPVVAADGYTYEREHIQAWFDKHPQGGAISPKTQQALSDYTLFPNTLLRNMIRQKLELLEQVTEIETQRDCVIQQLGEQNTALMEENRRLSSEKEEQRRLLLLRADLGSESGNLPIDDARQHMVDINRLELAIAELRNYKAVSIIQMNYLSHKMRQLLRSSNLQMTREDLQHQERIAKENFQSSMAVLREQIIKETNAENWDAIAPLVEQVETKQKMFGQKVQELDQTLSELLQAKKSKSGQIAIRAERLARIAERMQFEKERMSEFVGEQQRQTSSLSGYLEQRRFVLRVSAQKQELIEFQIPQTPEQQELQRNLVEASEFGNLEQIKCLIGADAVPNMLSSDGKHPFGAAIIGGNPEAVFFLNSIYAFTPDELKRILVINEQNYRTRNALTIPVDMKFSDLYDYYHHHVSNMSFCQNSFLHRRWLGEHSSQKQEAFICSMYRLSSKIATSHLFPDSRKPVVNEQYKVSSNKSGHSAKRIISASKTVSNETLACNLKCYLRQLNLWNTCQQEINGFIELKLRQRPSCCPVACPT